MLCSCHSIVFGAQFTCISTVKNVHVKSNSLLLPLYCFRCSIYMHFYGEECACELKFSAPATLLFSVLNLHAFPRWRMCIWTQILCSCHSIVFGAQFTCISTVKNVHVNSHALLLPLYCFRCSITLLLHPLICVADVLCACCGLPMKKPFAWMRDFAWQPNFPTDCRTVPTNVILHPIGVSLRPFVSSVTYVPRTRTPNTVISCQPNIFTLWVHPVVPATETKTKESGYSFHKNYFYFKNACWLTGEPG